ncbi:MAG: cell division protein ZapA [Alistipes sp.]|nr:cell division protein ZapA [Alistipes sp.]MDE6624103.1 cell division protein ZapA [Alistipes sp.]
MAQQAITLKIAGKSYSLNIESEKEEVYRLAEREVNKYLKLIKQNNFKNWTDQDYLSMAALKFAIANVDLKRSHEVDEGELRQIEAMDAEIDAYLNTLHG